MPCEVMTNIDKALSTMPLHRTRALYMLVSVIVILSHRPALGQTHVLPFQSLKLDPPWKLGVVLCHVSSGQGNVSSGPQNTTDLSYKNIPSQAFRFSFLPT